MTQVTQVLDERGEEYGKAWLLAGIILQRKEVLNSILFQQTPLSHNFVLVVSKLCRMLTSPYNTDHYIDAIGYLTLMLRWVEERNKG